MFLLTWCQGQKLMQKLEDAKKLQQQQEKFVNKPLKNLLAQISPEIKSTIGDVECINKKKMNTIIFYFEERKDFLRRKQKSENPTRIMVYLINPESKIYPKLDKHTPWSIEKTNIYGDFIVKRISVLGEN